LSSQANIVLNLWEKSFQRREFFPRVFLIAQSATFQTTLRQYWTHFEYSNCVQCS